MLLRLCDPNTSTFEWRALNFRRLPTFLIPDVNTHVEFITDSVLCRQCSGTGYTVCEDCKGTGKDPYHDCGDDNCAGECDYCNKGKISCGYCDNGTCAAVKVSYYPDLWLVEDTVKLEQYKELLSQEQFIIGRLKEQTASQSATWSTKQKVAQWNETCAGLFLLPTGYSHPATESGYVSETHPKLSMLFWGPLRARLAKHVSESLHSSRTWKRLSETIHDELKATQEFNAANLVATAKQYSLSAPTKAKKKATTKKSATKKKVATKKK